VGFSAPAPPKAIWGAFRGASGDALITVNFLNNKKFIHF
jgi:hypothetical protein